MPLAAQHSSRAPNDALRWLNAGKLGHALALSEQALTATPWSVSALVIHAIIRIHAKRFDIALASLMRAFALNPHDGNVLYRLGQCTQSMNEFIAAENWSLKAVSVRPDWADPYFMIGSNHHILGNYAVAAEWLAKAVVRRPNWAAAQFAVGRTLFLSGQRSAANSWLSKAVALDPGFRKHEEFLLATLTSDDFEAWFAEPM